MNNLKQKEQISNLTQSERLMAMGEMAASLAHELRNPLGSIELHAGLIKKTKAGIDKVREYATEIQRAVKTLNHIISNSLQFTREVKAKKQSFSAAKVFLSEICEYVIQGEETRCDLQKLDLTWTELGEEKFEIDPYLIGQVAINLLTNAIQARGTDVERVHSVQIAIDHSNKEYWILSVRDSGEGISEAVREKIFDPFFTTKEKGTGLGLAVVHSIVEAHQGAIEIESSPQAGTLFKITFLNK